MTKSTEYKQVLKFMYGQLPMYQRQGKAAFKKDLTNIISLCSQLKDPQLSFSSIHVAGTNGKGSVSHMIASVLQEYGLKVGLYTSPHYKDFRERIKINGQLISQEDVIDFMNRIQPVLDHIPASFFEITVAMAFDYFARKQVDVAIIETGLGGRLDSTNIIKPLLSVITNISLDHTDMLGDTIPLIAGEKAGIIKENTPVIIGEKRRDTRTVFENKAKEVNAVLTYAQDIGQCRLKEDSLSIDVAGRKVEIEMKNASPYFAENARTSIAAINQLDAINFIKWHSSKVEAGFKNLRKNTYYIGRWEVLSEQPKVIADSAHNEAGLKLVFNRISRLKYRKLHVVVGFVKDKSITEILKIFPTEATYYFVKADIPRGLDAKQLQKLASSFSLNGRSYVSVKNGLKAAKRNAEKEDLIFVGGSIFVLAEIL